MLEKSLTIDAQIPAGPPNPSVVAAAAARIISNIVILVSVYPRQSAGTPYCSPEQSASPPVTRWRRLGLLIHRGEEILVGLGVLHLVEQELHRVDRAHLHQDAPQHPHLGKLGRVDQQF